MLNLDINLYFLTIQCCFYTKKSENQVFTESLRNKIKSFFSRKRIVGFHHSFSRHGNDRASSSLLIWLKGNVGFADLFSPWQSFQTSLNSAHLALRKRWIFRMFLKTKDIQRLKKTSGDELHSSSPEFGQCFCVQ